MAEEAFERIKRFFLTRHKSVQKIIKIKYHYKYYLHK